MQVRPIEQTDLEQLAKLFNGYRVFYKKESNLNAVKTFLADRIKNQDSKIFVCEMADGSLVGFTQLYPLFSSTRMKKLWLLNDLYVAPDFRGKAIAIQLIERAKQLVKDTAACGMYLETRKTNVIGNNLYPKTGFVLNEVTNFYSWDVDV